MWMHVTLQTVRTALRTFLVLFAAPTRARRRRLTAPPFVHFCVVCSTDESATEAILKAVQSYSHLCGKLELFTPRDAFITALCKSSLPPHYSLTVLNPASASHAGQNNSHAIPRGNSTACRQRHMSLLVKSSVAETDVHTHTWTSVTRNDVS